MEYLIRSGLLTLFAGFFCLVGWAQAENGSALFSTDEIIDMRLSGDMREVMNDREAHAKYHPFTLTYQQEQGATSIPVRIRTRGHFRLAKGNCTYPPLLLNFAKKKTAEDPLFKDQDKMKLVTPCRGDKFVVQEYLVYKVYNLITPKSFRARLARVIYEDTVKAKSTPPMYGLLLEEERQVAKRNHSISIERKLRPEQTNHDDFLRMAVFEYLIGNTDWSIQFLQNVKLLAADSTVIPSTIPYDFDHAGIVRAPYAKPAPELELLSTQVRRYRGYCVTNMAEFDNTFRLFNSLKEQIYKVYTDSPLLDEKYIKSTVKFLDEFYDTINDPKEASKQFMYPCDKNGTGNVVIQGLNRD